MQYYEHAILQLKPTIIYIIYIYSSLKAEEEVSLEIERFKACTSRMFERQGKSCLFLETACHFSHNPHAHIEVVPIKAGKEVEAKMYFTNALSQADEEWSQHKKIIQFSVEKPLSKCIPQQFQYISVEWEDKEEGRRGLAHIIEDESRVRSDFALDVVAGMLKKDPLRFRSRQPPPTADMEVKRTKEFLSKYQYETFDWVSLMAGNF